jgi:hypothetical protein
VDRSRLIDFLCQRPRILGWPLNAPPTPTIQKSFPLLTGQIVDIAVWDSQNYWLVRVLPAYAIDSEVEHAAFECLAFKSAFEAELGPPPGKFLVVPVLFIPRKVQNELLDWAFQLGVYVRCVESWEIG